MKAELTDAQVKRMRELRSEGKYTYRELGEMFGYCLSGVALICRGKRRKHAGGPIETERAWMRPGHQRFTPEEIKRIRVEVRNGATGPQLARVYGVHRHTITSIACGKIYDHIGGPIRGKDY
ncbi:MAG: hypothetical protein KAJ19_25275 [Gammaproteobacteria bacterium]|nr:hypothetical protein [Gammaproteobacteria bacterium]